MCKLLLPKNDIACIRYFTALVKPRPNDPQQGQRQQIFLRALKTLPNISIHYGTFLSHVVPMQQRGSARPAGESSTPRAGPRGSSDRGSCPRLDPEPATWLGGGG